MHVQANQRRLPDALSMNSWDGCCKSRTVLRTRPRHRGFLTDGEKRKACDRRHSFWQPTERALLAFTSTRGPQLSAGVSTPRLRSSYDPYPQGVLQDSLTRVPLIVHVYPGSTGECPLSTVTDQNVMNLQFLIGRNYAVLCPALPWNLLRVGQNPTANLTNLTIAALDAALSQTNVDANRVGLIGISQGYQLVLQLLAETERFDAGVVLFGVSDAISHYGSMSLLSRLSNDQSVGFFGRYESLLGSPPWTSPDVYIRNSPVFSVERITTPTLIINSDLDVFPIGQSEEIFSALYRLGRDAEYVTYWGEGHGTLGRENLRDMWGRIFTWYDRHFSDPS